VERVRKVLQIAVIVLFAVNGWSCEWSPGYFHQITSLKGVVVGKALGPFSTRWLRQSFKVSGAQLSLLQYRDPLDAYRGAALKRVNSDSSGRFDFGSMPDGHYFLEIESEDLHDFFEVEITQKVPKTKSIKVDVSPVTPDCKGGHEFIVEN
jgi:hypothetical protein